MKFNNLVPMLAVQNVGKSFEFYQATLGFDVVNSREDNGEMNWCMLKSHHALLMLMKSGDLDRLQTSPRGPEAILYFYPDNAEELYVSLQSAGYPVSEMRVSQYGMAEFEIRDPDGYWLWFGQAAIRPSE
ncbi:MAG: VOC family protein [Planctomycetales bacterium]